MNVETYQFRGAEVKAVPPEEPFRLLAAAARSNRLVPVLGAGISFDAPAALPLAGELLAAIRNAIASFLPDEIGARIGAAMKEQTLEHLLDHVGQLVHDDVLELLDVLDCRHVDSRPAIAHSLIAQLARVGVSTFVTANFDTLLEEAFVALGSCVLVPEATQNEAVAYDRICASGGRCPVLLKLHGTIARRDSLFTTLELVGSGLPSYKESGLHRCVAGKSLFVAGYSDNDTDIFPALSRASVRHVFWYEHPVGMDRLMTRAAASAVRSYLRDRSGFVLVGELRDVLTYVHRELGGTAATYNNTVLEAETKHLRGERQRDLVERSRRFAEAHFTPSAAALLFARAIGANDATLSDALFARIDSADLRPEHRVAYWIESAERADKRLDRRRGLVARRNVRDAIVSARMSTNTRERLLTEHTLKLAWQLDDVGGFRNRRTAFRLKLNVAWWLLSGRLHDRYASGSTRSILLARAARLPAAASRKLLFRAGVAQARNEMLRSVTFRAVARAFAATACALYAVGRRIRYQSQGWLRVHRQSGGVMLVFAKGYVDRHASAIIEAGQTTAFTRGTPAWRSRMTGTPVMIRAAYLGKLTATVAAYRRTLRYALSEAQDGVAEQRAREAYVICAAQLVGMGRAERQFLVDAVREYASFDMRRIFSSAL